MNANIAMVSSFSIHHDRAEAIRRGHEGFEFFGYALNALVARDTVPGVANLVRLDPACAGLPVSAAAQSPRSRVALILCRGFAGTNAALVIRAA